MINPGLASGFKDIDGAHNVDLRTEYRVSAAERDLQRCQMNNVRNVLGFAHVKHLFAIGQVAANKGYGGFFIRRHEQIDPMAAIAKIEADDVFAVLYKMIQRPCTDTSQRACDKNCSFSHNV